METIYNLSVRFLESKYQDYHRYLFKEPLFKNKLTILTGQLGIGKTTVLIQYMLQQYKDRLSTEMLYVPVDHFFIGQKTLFEIAEQFSMLGGKLLCFDEIHKHLNWSQELKNITDSFPSLQVIASGSSALEIFKGSHDLSRRAVIKKMVGMSFREYLELKFNVNFKSINLATIVRKHRSEAMKIKTGIEKLGTTVLSQFKQYLRHGYYPFFREYENDETLFFQTLEQTVHTAIESDLVAVYPSLTGTSISKIKKLLSLISIATPFKCEMKTLKNWLDIGDERTLKTYLQYLNHAEIIKILYKYGKSPRVLEKPEKIYLNNSNQIFAFGRTEENLGNLRETFLLNTVSPAYEAGYPNQGDLQVGKYLFEIGGKSKTFSQIKNIPNSYLVLDDIELGMGNRIPLWLFGFLY